MTSNEFMNLSNPLKSILFAFAMKLTKNRDDAKDLFQETMLRAFAHKESFVANTNFKAWISTIMRNNFMSEYRKRRSRNNIELKLEEQGAFPMQYSVNNEGGSNLVMKEYDLMFKTINESQRRPFELFFKGYGYKEISQKLGMPIGTVKSRIFFARRKMKDLLAKVDARRA